MLKLNDVPTKQSASSSSSQLFRLLDPCPSHPSCGPSICRYVDTYGTQQLHWLSMTIHRHSESFKVIMCPDPMAHLQSILTGFTSMNGVYPPLPMQTSTDHLLLGVVPAGKSTYANRTTYSPACAHMCMLVTFWIACRHPPFAIVKDLDSTPYSPCFTGALRFPATSLSHVMSRPCSRCTMTLLPGSLTTQTDTPGTRITRARSILPLMDGPPKHVLSPQDHCPLYQGLKNAQLDTGLH
jgi:hypothetical protein